MSEFLSTAEREILKKLQKEEGKLVYIRSTVLLMLDSGLKVEDISRYLGVSISTVYDCRKRFDSEGLEKYLDLDYKGKWGLLSCREISILRKELKTNLYCDSNRIIAFIKSTFRVEYSVSGAIDLLHRIGFTYKQTTQVPCEADQEKQQAFLSEVLPPILSDVEKGEAILYYTDGVHPTHNTRSTHAWIEVGTEFEQPTVSGRDRVNINGAINAHNVEDFVYCETGSVNAQSTQKLYEQMLMKHQDKEKIYVIQDNAKYYRNGALQEWLVLNPKIKQVFLPAYSPNLNLIERLWKFMRKKVINTGFFRTKSDFRNALVNFFDNLNTHKEELVTLLTLKFSVINSEFKT